MDIGQLLEERKRLIDKKLDEFIPKESVIPKRLHKAMRYSVFSGGKRIRPILAIEGCLCCGGRISDVIAAACAVELVHTFSLVHDDLPAMDDDDYRRAVLTCHKKFDEATAILAGDALLSLAFKVPAGGRDAALEIALIKELSDSIGSLGIAGGQYVDIEYKGRPKSERILYYINSHKTAALIKASLKIGGMASGASAEKVRKIEKFGVYIGEVFQLVDDILDGGDSVSVLGKNAVIKRAKLLTEKAKDELKDFGNSAVCLRKLADYLIERKF